jgi:hypothetical protein
MKTNFAHILVHDDCDSRPCLWKRTPVCQLLDLVKRRICLDLESNELFGVLMFDASGWIGKEERCLIQIRISK